MPTTLAGLLIFVIALSPGFCYILRRERIFVSRDFSTFRESASVILGSILSLGISLSVFSIFRSIFPKHTPDIGALVRTPKLYIDAHYAYLAWWGVAILATACIISVIAPHVFRWWSEQDLRSKLPDWASKHIGSGQDIKLVPAWWEVFEANPDKSRRVVCKLEDGSHVEGVLHTYSHASNETGDRDFVLGAPLIIRDPDGDALKEDVGGLVISAKRLMYLYVDYIDPVD
jgi:hypothetical protein